MLDAEPGSSTTMSHLLPNLRAAASVVLLATCASALSTFPEVEPNETKDQATANGVILLTAGDVLSGTTTGSSTTTPGAASADTWRIRTAPLPAGIYRHTLTLTTSGAAGHVGSIRGLVQTSGPGLPGTIGTTDFVFMTSSTTTNRSVSWYGFGRAEEIYYRVTGTTSTIAPYDATLTTVAVAPVAGGSFAAGSIRFQTVGQTTLDTEIHILDGTLTVIDDASNDDESISEGGTGTTLQSMLTRTLPPGTAYLAVGRFNVATNDNSPATDDFRTGNVLDFRDAIACSSSSVSPGGSDFDLLVTDSSGATAVPVLGPANEPYSLVFVQFTITGSTPPPIAFCFGDGSGTACPCGNAGAAGNGCANSINPAGANLAWSGTPSISSDTFTLLGSGMPDSSVLYFQGTARLGGGLGVAFEDGLRCAGGTGMRLLMKTNVGGASQYPEIGDVPISIHGSNAPGTVRTYQAWYRNAADFCTPSTFNLTNGVEATWGP